MDENKLYYIGVYIHYFKLLINFKIYFFKY